MVDSSEFAAMVKDFGGDDDDIALLDGVDVDGSDIEGETAADPALASEVDKLWKQLSNTGNKTKFDDESGEKVANAAVELDKAEKNRLKREEKRLKKQSKTQEAKEAGTKPKQDSPQAGQKTSKPAKKSEQRSDVSITGINRATKDTPMEPKPETKKEKKARELSAKAIAKQSELINGVRHPGDLVLEVGTSWYDYEGNAGNQPLAPELYDNLKQKASALLEKEGRLYQDELKQSRESSASLEFLRNGTFSDQLGTLSLLIAESPVHSVKFLENLLEKTESKNRESAVRALEVTKDVIVSQVLPDRRLAWFKDQPLTIDSDYGYLIVWAYEDWLKHYFFRMLQVIERLLSDSVENIRIRTLHVVFDLFQKKPEQELNLLRLGVNKLGDPAGKVASRVKKLLLDVFLSHPGMKSIVASIISETLSRSSSDYKIRYYAVDTLSEFILSQKDATLPNQLISIYLNLFERLLAEWTNHTDAREEKAPTQKSGRRPLRGKKGGIRQEIKTASQVEEEQNARLVAKIFTGLNRAFPFSKLEASLFEQHTDTLYRMSHSPNAGTYIEALNFIFQLAKAHGGAGTDRYYRALYESLLDARLYQSAKVSKYITLLLKSLVDDLNQERSAAFAKRILQTALTWPEVGAVASLVYVAEYTPAGLSLIDPTPKNAPAVVEEAYDFKARDPKFAKADTSKMWEVIPLLNHYHPTVTLYAENLLAEDRQRLDMPDIDQYTVNSFLAKWSYKKPKEKESTRGGSIFQPLSGYTDITLGVRQQGPASSMPISVQDWVGRKKSDVAPDEQFYHQFFNKVQTSEARKNKQKKMVKLGENENDSEEDEEEVFDAIMRTNPDEMGSDNDLGFSDMENDVDADSDSVDEEALAAAFGSDSEAGSAADSSHDDLEDGLSDDDGDLDDQDQDLDGSEGGLFSEVSEEESEPEDADIKNKGRTTKRKRDWAGYPAFMDADAFEEMYAKKAKGKK